LVFFDKVLFSFANAGEYAGVYIKSKTLKAPVHHYHIMVRNDRDTAVVFAQIPLLKSQLEELKRRSGEQTTKDALHAAVNHYLNCPVINGRTEGEEQNERENKKIRR